MTMQFEAAAAGRPSRPQGVVTSLLTAVARMGMQIQQTRLVGASAEVEFIFAFAECSYKEWQHGVRHVLRTHSLTYLCSRRSTFEGAQGGINRSQTLVKSTNSHFSAWMRCWHLDGILTPTRLDPKGDQGLACRRCGIKSDDWPHQMWECPALSSLRRV